MSVSPSPEEREFAVLRGELQALEQDIASARATSAKAHDRMDFLAKPEPTHTVAGERVECSDGSCVRIRRVEPHDAPELELGLEHVSAMSRYRRFRDRTTEYRQDEVAEILKIDHTRREALGAFEEESGVGVGMARYVRDPHDQAQADVTYLVADEWQRRGLGTMLLERLVARARDAGIERLTATFVVDDEAGPRLLAEVADPVNERRDGGILDVTARLRPAS
jgi:GNAT superfamily N-acetyltransferase